MGEMDLRAVVFSKLAAQLQLMSCMGAFQGLFCFQMGWCLAVLVSCGQMLTKFLNYPISNDVRTVSLFYFLFWMLGDSILSRISTLFIPITICII
jgi:hypothetical protein